MNFRFRPFHMGIVVSIAAAMVVLFIPEEWLAGGRERYFDRLTQMLPPPHSPDIAVVDIDRKAFMSAQDQRWQRSDTARLVEAVAADRPEVIAFDLVFSTDCNSQDSTNKLLATALSKSPSILGFLLSDVSGPPPHPLPPLAIARSLTVPEVWFLPGAETACPLFQSAAASTGASFLIGDDDSRVRRVQAFSILGDDPFPALGLEAVRQHLRANTPILGGTPPWLKLGPKVLSLTEDGSLRFVASDRAEIAKRTVSAADVLAANPPKGFFTDKIVFIGSSMPNMGGLRPSAAEPLVASVQIHADLANSLIEDAIPLRDDTFVEFEAGFVLLAGLGVALMTVRFRPSIIALGGLGVIALSLAVSAGLYATRGWLTDGFTVGAALTAILLVTAFSQFAETRRAERMARQRFSQYLPKSVVNRYIDNPNAKRMAGEERQVTALFTDIEGFSALAGRVHPQVLVGMLNVYFAEVTELVSVHGGMIDKIVGDAVHAFFNAPEDLDDHVNKAIDCALAISRLTEEMRQRRSFREHDFGRTRLGIETGMAVLGEVGIGGKLDYTAHGNAINLAARLQDANKFLGTTICVGPAAAFQSTRSLRSLGEHEIRGFGSMELFTPDDFIHAD